MFQFIQLICADVRKHETWDNIAYHENLNYILYLINNTIPLTKAESDRICSGMDGILYLINNTIPVVKSSFFKSVMETIFSSSYCNMFVLRFPIK